MNTAVDNPFWMKSAPDLESDESLVAKAVEGQQEALEELVRRHQAWLYNLAIRMVRLPQDAEDATQEILLKAVTHLDSFRGESKFRTWLWRIAIRHVLKMKKRTLEEPASSFDEFARRLDHCEDGPLKGTLDAGGPEVELLIEEARVSCTMAMLLCLDREQRIIFVLGDIFSVDSRVGGELLEITPVAFRQRLTRARRDLYAFMQGKCGLANRDNPCRCRNKTRAFIEKGLIDPNRLEFAKRYLRQVKDVAPQQLVTLQGLDEQYSDVYRSHPFLEPRDHVVLLRRVLKSDAAKKLLN